MDGRMVWWLLYAGAAARRNAFRNKYGKTAIQQRRLRAFFFYFCHFAFRPLLFILHEPVFCGLFFLNSFFFLFRSRQAIGTWDTRHPYKVCFYFRTRLSQHDLCSAHSAYGSKRKMCTSKLMSAWLWGRWPIATEHSGHGFAIFFSSPSSSSYFSSF